MLVDGNIATPATGRRSRASVASVARALVALLDVANEVVVALLSRVLGEEAQELSAEEALKLVHVDGHDTVGGAEGLVARVGELAIGGSLLLASGLVVGMSVGLTSVARLGVASVAAVGDSDSAVAGVADPVALLVLRALRGRGDAVNVDTRCCKGVGDDIASNVGRSAVLSVAGSKSQSVRVGSSVVGEVAGSNGVCAVVAVTELSAKAEVTCKLEQRLHLAVRVGEGGSVGKVGRCEGLIASAELSIEDVGVQVAVDVTKVEGSIGGVIVVREGKVTSIKGVVEAVLVAVDGEVTQVDLGGKHVRVNLVQDVLVVGSGVVDGTKVELGGVNGGVEVVVARGDRCLSVVHRLGGWGLARGARDGEDLGICDETVDVTSDGRHRGEVGLSDHSVDGLGLGSDVGALSTGDQALDIATSDLGVDKGDSRGRKDVIVDSTSAERGYDVGSVRVDRVGGELTRGEAGHTGSGSVGLSELGSVDGSEDCLAVSVRVDVTRDGGHGGGGNNVATDSVRLDIGDVRNGGIGASAEELVDCAATSAAESVTTKSETTCTTVAAVEVESRDADEAVLGAVDIATVGAAAVAALGAATGRRRVDRGADLLGGSGLLGGGLGAGLVGRLLSSWLLVARGLLVGVLLPASTLDVALGGGDGDLGGAVDADQAAEVERGLKGVVGVGAIDGQDGRLVRAGDVARAVRAAERE